MDARLGSGFAKMIKSSGFKVFSIGILWGWLFLFALLPFIFVALVSFLKSDDQALFQYAFTYKNYAELFNPVYLKIFFRSFYLSLIITFFCWLLGYPFAYIIAKMPKAFRSIWIFFVIIPFWTSGLIRVYSIIVVIRVKGWLNHVLLSLGLIHQPLDLLYSQAAVLFGSVYVLLPFMILPLFANLEKFDWGMLEAAKDLGANRWQQLRKIILPLTMPGTIAGALLVFLPAMTMFYIPDILGGARSLLLGNLIKNEFIEAHQWPLGSAVSVMLTLVMAVMLAIYWRLTTARQRREFV